MARFPPDRDDLSGWFSDHEREWREGAAWRFAILDGLRMVGLVDIDETSNGECDLGYWLEQPAWGRGYAFEAAGAVVRFAFETVGLTALKSGHAADNPASGRVLTKLGFRQISEAVVSSRSRGCDIWQIRYRLVR